MATIREFFQNLLYQVPAIGISDIVDILVVSIIFYSLLRLIRSTSAARVARAILLLLAIIGGINWGIYGIWGFNAVGWLLGGSLSWLSRTVFILVGLAALCLIPSLCMGDSCKGKEA